MNRKLKIIIGVIILGLAGFISYGMWAYTDLSKNADNEETYGKVVEATRPVPINSLLTGEMVNNVTIEGEVVSMGPTMGCWLVVNDGTEEIVVQTEPMIFINQGVKGKTIRATGSLSIANGGMGYSGKTLVLLTSGVETVPKASNGK